MGADIVKVFPATSLGPGFIKDLRGPFPSIKLMPTGGVSRATTRPTGFAPAPSRLASARALVDPKAVEAGRFDAITANARAFVDAVRGARSPFAKATGDR